MDIKELKKDLLNGIVEDSFKIFVCPENTFLADQYLEEMCSISGKSIDYISSIYDTSNDAMAMVFDFNQELHVLRTDVFDEYADTYGGFNNIIVICKSVDKKIAALTEDFQVKFPALSNWQKIDYMKAYCKGLSMDEYNWLYLACIGDIYRIKNELDKLMLFPESDRSRVLNGLKSDMSTDLVNLKMTDLSEAIALKKTGILYSYLKYKNRLVINDKFQELIASPDLDPIALINLVLSKYKSIAYFRSGKPAEKVGISEKQAKFYKFNPDTAKYDTRKVIPFLADLDLKLKNNQLDAEPDVVISYLICKMFA